MPPKKAVAAGPPTASRTSSRTKAAVTSAPTKSTATKRKATDDETEQPAAKRGRPAPKIAAPKSVKPPTSKTTTTKPVAKASAKAPTKTSTKAAAAKATQTSKAPVKASVKPVKAATGTSKKGPGRPKKTESAVAIAPKSTKRKSEDVEQPATRPAKKTRPASAKKIINEAPTERLDVYVFGEGDMGELGLGTHKTAKNVKRPRLNPLLAAGTVGIVQVATGGMHCVALTHDNQIITWGVNDQGACGRDTEWEGGLKDMDAKSDASDSDEEEDNGLNPREAEPSAVPADAFPEDVRFVQVAAGDSTSFALTDDGFVYGWGTFRSNEGILGFTADIQVQRVPMLIPGLKKIKHVACGANHVLALDINGSVFAWGSGQQNQLGRRVVERTRMAGLVPREFGLPKKQIKTIACGGYHSFAIDKKDNVFSWGLNNYGACGISDNAGDDDAIVGNPTKIATLAGRKLKCIKGGGHHSIAVTEEGECLVWGRADGSQMGIDLDTLAKDELIHDDKGNARILKNPTKVPGITCEFATAESDHCIAITTDGQAYSWGFSANYQTGQGTDDDVETATLIDNTAVRGKQLNWAGAGGQFSVITGIAGQTGAKDNATNGVHSAPPVTQNTTAAHAATDSAAPKAQVNGSSKNKSSVAKSTSLTKASQSKSPHHRENNSGISSSTPAQDPSSDTPPNGERSSSVAADLETTA